MKLDVLGDRPQHTLPPSLGQNRRSNLLEIDKQANKWPAATCGGIKGGCTPLCSSTAGCRQLRAKMAKIIIFHGFFRRCFRTPRCIPMKFESSIVMYSPIHLPKYQPNRPTGGRAIGRGIWQSKAKNGENCHFSSVFPPPLPHTSSHPNEI